MGGTAYLIIVFDYHLARQYTKLTPTLKRKLILKDMLLPNFLPVNQHPLKEDKKLLRDDDVDTPNEVQYCHPEHS